MNSGALAATVPALLGGPTHLTVGLMAAFVAVACIIAADTGAYFCGKSFGRTQVRGGGRRRGGGQRGWRGARGQRIQDDAHPPGHLQSCGQSLVGWLLPACLPACTHACVAQVTHLFICPPPPPPPQLTRVSPKKTVEGALGGLLSSIAVALGLYKVGGRFALGDAQGGGRVVHRVCSSGSAAGVAL